MEATPSSTHGESGRLLRRSPRARGGWRSSLTNQVKRLSDELDTLPAPGEADRSLFDSYRQVVERHLASARQRLEPVGPIQLVSDWYSGAAIESASASIARASETLLMIQSPAALATELPDIRAAFESNLPLDDPRRLELKPALDKASEIILAGTGDVDDVLRGRLRAARRAANAVTAAAQASVRRWRNALVWGGLSVTALTVLVALIHAVVPSFLDLGANGSESGVAPWAVELVGAVGGALAAVFALNRFSGFTDPYGLPTAQALLRIPTAAATSLFAVVLMQTSALGALKPQTEDTTVLAFAFVFGYAQEPLLRMIDRQAGKVLNPARDKSDPVKRSTPEPTESEEA